MAVSGSEDFTLNGLELITYALKKCRLIGAGQSIDSDVAEDARIELNLLLKDLQKYDVVWQRKEASVTIVSADISGITQASPGVVTTSAAHNISDGDLVYFSGISGMTELNGQFVQATSASGTTFTLSGLDTSSYTAYGSGGKARVSRYNLATNARKLYDVNLRQAYSSGARDLPMTPMTRDDYKKLPTKGSSGVTTQYYLDVRRTESHLHVWPLMSDITNTPTIEYSYRDYIDDIDALTDDLEVNPEYHQTIRMLLAKQLGISAGLGDSSMSLIIREAEKLENDMISDSQEEFYQFQPDEQHG